MPKGFKVICLMLVIILSVGCMDIKLKMNISSDKSVDFTMTEEIDLAKYMEVALSFSDQTMSESEMQKYLKENINEIDTSEFLDDETKQNLEAAGYTVTTNMDNENYLYTINISQHFANIDDISTNEEQTTTIDNLLSGEGDNIFFTKTSNGTYKANLTTQTEETNTEISLEEMQEYITFNYEVTLPNASISNNADSVSSDNKTLSWDLMKTSEVNFEFSFPTSQKSSMSEDTLKLIAIALIAGGSIVLIAAIIIFVKNQKKNA